MRSFLDQEQLGPEIRKLLTSAGYRPLENLPGLIGSYATPRDIRSFDRTNATS